MFGRFAAAASVAAFAISAVAPGLARAQAGKAAPSPPSPPPPIQRAVATLGSVAGAQVQLRTADGKTLTVMALNPRLLLLKNKAIARSKDFKAGDKLVVYSHPLASGGNLLDAVTDLPSEIVLVELKTKPVAATFKSFDPKTSKLTVVVGGATKAYTVVSPIMVLRNGRKAVLGKARTQEQEGYGAGDKLLLVLTADKKQVRMVVDSPSYDFITGDLKRFPLPPASKIPPK